MVGSGLDRIDEGYTYASRAWYAGDVGGEHRYRAHHRFCDDHRRHFIERAEEEEVRLAVEGVDVGGHVVHFDPRVIAHTTAFTFSTATSTTATASTVCSQLLTPGGDYSRPAVVGFHVSAVSARFSPGTAEAAFPTCT